MKQIIELKDFVAKNGQVKTSEMLGVTQAAISKALATKRQIFIEELDGSVTAFEKKRFPSFANFNLAGTGRKAKR